MPFYLRNTGKGEVEVQEGPILVPGSNEILVKVSSIASNPTDWQQNAHAPNVGSTVGYEFSGTVETLGAGVTKFRVSDRVAGFNFGNCPFNNDYGAFGQYAIGFEHTTFHIPEYLSNDEAVTLPTAFMVTGQALYQNLGFPPPNADNKPARPFLINGGSTAMGIIALQFAKLSGAKPLVATSSPSNFALLKSLGADEVFDYHDPECASNIREYTKGELTKALDAASTGDTVKLTAECLGSSGEELKVVVLNPPPPTGEQRKDVEYPMTLTMTAFGTAFKLFDFELPENQADKAFMTEFWNNSIKYVLEKELIKPVPVRLVPGGLSGVKDGWELMKAGKVSGQKLVGHIDDTPGI